MIFSFYTLSKRLFLKRKGLFDARVVLITKKEYGFTVNCLQRFMNSLKTIHSKLKLCNEKKRNI